MEVYVVVAFVVLESEERNRDIASCNEFVPFISHEVVAVFAGEPERAVVDRCSRVDVGGVIKSGV